jgi:hypothetical protein
MPRAIFVLVRRGEKTVITTTYGKSEEARALF